MTTDNKSTTRSESNGIQEQRKLYLDVLLAEYNKLENQIQQHLRENHELALYSLAFITGITTLVVALLDTKYAELLSSILLILPLPFTAMLLSAIGNINMLTTMGKYVSKHIESDVNKILQISSDPLPIRGVLRWETYLYTETSIIDKLLGAALRSWGQAALVSLPLVGSLVAYRFVVEQAHLVAKDWQVVLLRFDFVLLVVALLMAAVTAIRGLNKVKSSLVKYRGYSRNRTFWKRVQGGRVAWACVKW